jgi:hypothetical protein
MAYLNFVSNVSANKRGKRRAQGIFVALVQITPAIIAKLERELF